VGTLVLDRLWANTEFYDWFKTVYDGNVQRKSISVVFLTDDGTESSRVNLHECWPKKWKLNGLHSRTSGHIVESLEIMFERVEFA
jgi:phage tail-like protein